MQGGSIPCPHAGLDSCHWVCRKHTSKGNLCFANQVCIRCLLKCKLSLKVHLNSYFLLQCSRLVFHVAFCVFFSYGLSTWSLDCGGGNGSFCEESQLLSITSSVTFIDIPYNTGPPKSR